MIIYRYKVTLEYNDELERKEVYGIVMADSMAGAVEKLVKNYGDVNTSRDGGISEINLLRSIGDGEVIEVNKEHIGAIDAIEEGWIW